MSNTNMVELKVPQNAVIIGGGSHESTGGQVALDLAKRGCKKIVILYGRTMKEELVTAIEAEGAEVIAVACDFSKIGVGFSADAIVEQVTSALGEKIELVFCASGKTITAEYDEVCDEDALLVMQIGFVGPRQMVPRLASHMKKGSVIVVLGSNHEFADSDAHLDYGAAKMALGKAMCNMARPIKKEHDVTLLYLATGWIWEIKRHLDAVATGECPEQAEILKGIPAGRIWVAGELTLFALLCNTLPFFGSFIGHKMAADGGDTGRFAGALED